MGVTIDPPGAIFGPRTSPHYEMLWLMEGEATARVGKQVIQCKEGTILLRRAGVQDYYEWSTQHRTVHAYIHFDLDKGRQKRVSQAKVPTFRKMTVSDVIRPLFLYLLKLEERPQTIQSALMLPVLDLILESYIRGEVELKTQPSSNLPEPVGRAIEMIRMTMAQNPVPALPLNQIAAASGTTPGYLCRIFKKTVEVGPVEYAKMARLDKAAQQLRTTNLSLKEIASITGFFDAFHLSKSFKQVYGLSPKSFRHNSKNEWISQRNPIIRTLYCRFDPNACPNEDETAPAKKKP